MTKIHGEDERFSISHEKTCSIDLTEVFILTPLVFVTRQLSYTAIDHIIVQVHRLTNIIKVNIPVRITKRHTIRCAGLCAIQHNVDKHRKLRTASRSGCVTPDEKSRRNAFFRLDGPNCRYGRTVAIATIYLYYYYYYYYQPRGRHIHALLH
jgi:hypothetical protein